MSSITIELDNEIASLLDATGQSAPAAARELVVMELYRLGRLSTGLSPDDLESELRVARNA